MENMNIYIGIMEYMNMSVCISARSLCFRFIVVAMAGFALNWFINFFWVFTSRFRPQSSNNKRKKKSVRKKKKAQIYANNDVSVDANSDVNNNSNVNDDSLPKDTKDGSMESIRVFTYQALADSTQNFLLDRRMNVDCLGPVYKGKLVDTNEVFAVRHLKEFMLQSLDEFVGEVLLLSQANHQNLAKLIGYCIRHHHCRLLVYKYESGGSLDNHLHGNKTCLGWKMRMKIAFGVGNALDYLQNSMKPPILHCYIHPSNIWLDEEMTPKLSAFGVVRMYLPPSKSDFCFETIGSYLYGSHDKKVAKKVTVETDIYGFGIFLLEIITGIKGRFRTKDGVRRNLTDWVRPYFEDRRNLANIVDPKLEGNFNVEELHEVCNIAEACLEEQPSRRPPISDVVKRMEGLAR